jgi:hypothetical protein
MIDHDPFIGCLNITGFRNCRPLKRSKIPTIVIRILIIALGD